MPFVRFLASKCCTCVAVLILLLSEIMPTYSRYLEKKLLCIVIITLFNCQPFSYLKYTRANMRFLYNIYLVSNNKYISFICFNGVVYA